MLAFYNHLKEKGKNGKVIVCRLCDDWFTLSLVSWSPAKSTTQIISRLSL